MKLDKVFAVVVPKGFLLEKQKLVTMPLFHCDHDEHYELSEFSRPNLSWPADALARRAPPSLFRGISG